MRTDLRSVPCRRSTRTRSDIVPSLDPTDLHSCSCPPCWHSAGWRGRCAGQADTHRCLKKVAIVQFATGSVGRRRRRSSQSQAVVYIENGLSVSKWADGKSQERFNLEWPSFTETSGPTFPGAKPNTTPLAAAGLLQTELHILAISAKNASYPNMVLTDYDYC